jgi:hypothetical protein
LFGVEEHKTIFSHATDEILKKYKALTHKKKSKNMG